MSITQKAGIVDIGGKTVQVRIGDNLFYGTTTQTGKSVVLNIQSCVMSNLGNNTPYIGIENLQDVSDILGALGAMSRCAYGSTVDTTLTKVTGNGWVYAANDATVKAGIIGAGQALYIPNLQGQIMFSSEKGYSFVHTLNPGIVGVGLGGFQFVGNALYAANIPLINTYFSGAEATYIALKMPTVGSYVRLNQVQIAGRTINVNMNLSQVGENYKQCPVDNTVVNDIMGAISSIPMGGSGQVVFIFSNGQERFVLTRYY